MIERLQYPLSHEWHVAVNRHSDEWRKADKEWGEMRVVTSTRFAGPVFVFRVNTVVICEAGG